MAEKANREVEKLRKRLLAESEKSHAKMKKELGAARKKYAAADSRLKKARGALRKRATVSNQKKVDALLKQGQELADAVGDIAKAAYEAAEKMVTVKTDAVLADRRAAAANQTA